MQLSSSPSVRHLLVTVGPRSFGLGSVALNLVREQRALGIDARIWCLDSAADVAWAQHTGQLPPEAIMAFPPTGLQSMGFSIALERAVTGDEGRQVHLLHQHGIWTGMSRAANRWRRAFGHPTVVAPHGSMEPWALERSAWKKRLACMVYQSENFRETACFHATAGPEAEGIIRYGTCRPVAVLPNGLPGEWLESAGDAEAFRSHYRLPADARILLYVGRITPVKNLEMLIVAMDRARDELSNWVLVIAGTDEFGYKGKVEEMIARLELQRHVRFVAFVPHELMRAAYAAASAFALPSRREASPIAVLEALGAGVPVLTTHGTPWKELEDHRCGWWCAVDLDAMTQALRSLLSSPPSVLAACGARGRELARAKYTWAIAARHSVDLYQWLWGRAGKPEFVVK